MVLDHFNQLDTFSFAYSTQVAYSTNFLKRRRGVENSLAMAKWEAEEIVKKKD